MDINKLSSINISNEVVDSSTRKEADERMRLVHKRIHDNSHRNVVHHNDGVRVVDGYYRNRIVANRINHLSRRNAVIMDSRRYSTLKNRIYDDLQNTETTEEAVDAVIPYLKNANPEDVLQAAVEILSSIIDNLTSDEDDEDKEPDDEDDEDKEPDDDEDDEDKEPDGDEDDVDRYPAPVNEEPDGDEDDEAGAGVHTGAE